MKTQRRLTATVLVLALLLGLFGGGVASAAAPVTVTTGGEIAYVPLDREASVAYERHEDGYEVSLDRAADSVTMNITAVPADAAARTPEKARLYVHTGVELKAGTAYQVSFSLSAQQDQPEYAVSFDGTAQGAYGTLTGRSVKAGGADKVKYQLTPTQAGGELVLCLLLGKTGGLGNTLRLSDLAVEEAVPNQVGENVVLVDALDYSAPGFIRSWTNDDSAAVITADEDSATLTVTQAPTNGAEVWKIKLLVATGLKPEPGKTYHFTADVKSSAARKYEICYNEGDTEKGYDVLYNQKLAAATQTIERRIYIPRDKANPGELIVQLSLGMLETGDTVTISNVTVEEEIPQYTNILPSDFSYEDHAVSVSYRQKTRVLSATPLDAEINWAGGASVSTGGDADKLGELTTQGGSATLKINYGYNVWEARIHVDTGKKLTAGTPYRVSFDIKAKNAYEDYEILYGDGLTDEAYGADKGQSIDANVLETKTHMVTPAADGGLVIKFQLGKTGEAGNEVTVSNFKIEEMIPGQAGGKNLAEVTYPGDDAGSSSDTEPVYDPGSFSMRVDGDHGGVITGDGASATVTCTGGAGSEWQRGLVIKGICDGLAPGRYAVNLTVEADRDINYYRVCYNNGNDWADGVEADGHYGKVERRDGDGLKAGTPQTLTHEITVLEGNQLFVRIDLGEASEGTVVTVRDVKVEKLDGEEETPGGDSSIGGENLAQVTYPSEGGSSPVTDTGSFSVRDGHGSITVGGENSATMICEDVDNKWEKGMFIGGEGATICTLEAGSSYEVSFGIQTDGQEITCNVCYNKDMHFGEGEKAFGEKRDIKASAAEVTSVTQTVTPDADGGLCLFLEFPDANTGTKVTVKDIEVKEITDAAGNKAGVTYPDSFSVRDGHGSIAAGDGESVVMTCEDVDNKWEKGMFIGGEDATICTLKAGSSYEVSFGIRTDGQEITCNAFYNKDMHFGEGEKAFGEQRDIKASAAEVTSVTQTVTPEADGGLCLFLEFPDANTGTKVTVSDVQVREVDTGGSSFAGATVKYPTSSADSAPTSGSFSVRDGHGSITVGGENSATMICEDVDNKWEKGMFIGGEGATICTLEAGSSYEVSFGIQTDGQEITCNVCYNKDMHFGEGEKAFGEQRDIKASAAEVTTVTQTVTPEADGGLCLFLEFPDANTGTKVTISNIQVKALSAGGSSSGGVTGATVQYPNLVTGGSSGSGGHSFSVRDGLGVITGDGHSATMCRPNEGEPWQWAMFTGTVCTFEAAGNYEVSFDITANMETTYDVLCNKNGDWGAGEGGFAKANDQKTSSGTFKQAITAAAGDKLSLRIDLGKAPENAQITISNIQVVGMSEYTPSGNVMTVNSFATSGISTEAYDGYTAEVERNADNAVLKVTKSGTAATWKAKLCIDTGLSYEPGKDYRFKFDITAENDCGNFCVITKGALNPDDDIRGTWSQSIGAGETKTITTRPMLAGRASGALAIDIELGNFASDTNTYTVSNVVVEEVVTETTQEVARERSAGGTGVNVDMQRGYDSELTRNPDSATLNITKTPPSGAEAWKMKMFINPSIAVSKGQAVRVTFDVVADNDMDFEVCYNRGGTEKGFDAVYGLHAQAGTVKTVEKVFTAETGGNLIVQLSLGMVKAPNMLTVRNLQVEGISYTPAGKSALSAEVDYQQAGGDVTYWAHQDYAVDFVNDAPDAITAHITAAPELGAEPWKIKLFLDTGAVLEAGKYYKVTADFLAEKSQDFEICYNNGGVEFGYDSLGGLRLEGGKPMTVEQIVSVPADKTDLNNLMLQINLGKTTVANDVTVSGVTVEEVSLAYIDRMDKDFAYTSGSSVSLWTNPDYTAAMDTADGAATVHITQASPDAAVWKVKLFAHTGAMLQPGKTYLVSADMLAAKEQKFEICYNNEETEKGYDALYDQTIPALSKTTVEHKLTVPASMTDAGELVLQFAVGGNVANDITVSNISVRELNFGTGGAAIVPDTVIDLQGAAGALNVTREKLTYKTSQGKDNTFTVKGADLRANEFYTVTFTAKSDQALTGTLSLRKADGGTQVLSRAFQATLQGETYHFTTDAPLTEGGCYDVLWQFGGGEDQALGSAQVEISNIIVYSPPETLQVMRSTQNVTVNGRTVTPDAYAINGYNYFKLRDLAMLLNDTDAQFVVRYNDKTNRVSITTGKAYTPIGGELTVGEDKSGQCIRSAQSVEINGETVNLKAYCFGGYNYFRVRDLDKLLGYQVDYVAATNTVAITSARTPEAQEAGHAYDLFFRPAIDGEVRGFVGDTMPYYEDGTYYIYYLKEGGDAYNHSVYLVTTTDFVHYTEHDNAVLSASREDVQDSWIGTGSVVKVEGTYYFFYTGFNSSGSQEYHEKIMVAKSSSPTAPFTKVTGWEIVPPAELGQKNDFRDPQAYYDPATQTISLTVTASQGGTARILKYTLDKDLKNAKYDGIIFTDPTGAYWNLECSDTFRIGNKWYLTYSGQDDSLWYAMADSRFGPYSGATRLDGKVFYAAKHVEDGNNTYMVGWVRRSNDISPTQVLTGWAGNLVAQKLLQRSDGSLALVPVDNILSQFATPRTLAATEATVTAGAEPSYQAAFTSTESFMLKGAFTYTGTGSFGLAFDYNGKVDEYKLISLDPATGKLSLSFNGGKLPIADTKVALTPGQTHTFTYIQDGSVGIFYLDDQASLAVRLYGVTDKSIYLFAENNSVTFTSLEEYTR